MDIEDTFKLIASYVPDVTVLACLSKTHLAWCAGPRLELLKIVWAGNDDFHLKVARSGIIELLDCKHLCVGSCVDRLRACADVILASDNLRMARHLQLSPSLDLLRTWMATDRLTETAMYAIRKLMGDTRSSFVDHMIIADRVEIAAVCAPADIHWVCMRAVAERSYRLVNAIISTTQGLPALNLYQLFMPNIVPHANTEKLFAVIVGRHAYDADVDLRTLEYVDLDDYEQCVDGAAATYEIIREELDRDRQYVAELVSKMSPN